MNTYQKLAVLILRLAGVCWTLFLTFAWSVYGIEVLFGAELKQYPTHSIIGSLGYIALGIFVIATSKPLGRFIGRGLDD